jgi:flagellar assembly factor FliW
MTTMTHVPGPPETAGSHREQLQTGLARRVEFVEPLPGFPNDREFALTAVDPDGVLFTLRSLARPELRFVVMPPAGFFPDYHPAVTEAAVASLGVVTEVELQLLVVVSVQNGIADATANLLAPIVLVPETGRAMQVVLEDPLLPLRAPLLPGAS